MSGFTRKNKVEALHLEALTHLETDRQTLGSDTQDPEEGQGGAGVIARAGWSHHHAEVYSTHTTVELPSPTLSRLASTSSIGTALHPRPHRRVTSSAASASQGREWEEGGAHRRGRIVQSSNPAP